MCLDVRENDACVHSDDVELVQLKPFWSNVGRNINKQQQVKRTYGQETNG